ncbi:MAG TPA: ABC transporter permease [Xanthomonadaceae bacterium]|nr:ABC transporter permease [Xanthomonadaceae bacterium]
MNWVMQVWEISLGNLRSIPQRLGTSLVIVIGIAGVVAVLVALLAMGEGFRHTLASTGSDDRALVLRSGANEELASGFAREQADAIAQAPGVARDPDGRALVSPERYILTNLVNRANQEPSNIPVRGVDPVAFTLRPEVRIVEGRMLVPGAREVIVGRKLAGEFLGTGVGDSVPVRDGDWRVVGVFESGGDVHESELWVDRATLDGVLRSSAVGSVMVQLEDAAAFDRFEQAVADDPRVNVDVKRQSAYYAAQSEATGTFIRVLGTVVASIMALGAIFAALNTMYSAVSTRTREIATLRAIGFGGGPVVTSVLVESLALALLGGLLGGLLAWVLFNGFTVSTLNFQTFSQVAFSFRVTPELLVRGLVWALAIGLVGGLLPALRAARLPVTTALREG